MYAIQGGKVEINPTQIVSAHKEKGGDEWRLFMTDDKTFVVTKHEYSELKLLSCGGGSTPTPITLPPHFTISLQGTVDPV